MFPGAFTHSSYGSTTYDGVHTHLKMIYIPWESDIYSSVSSCFSSASSIPAIISVNAQNRAKMFCIHFHGNACDIGQIAICANRESTALHCHYLLVEYPGFGISSGYSSEVTINQMAISVYNFVMREFKIPANRIVLIGRSIGTGPVCFLASHLQRAGTPPLGVVLHSPYASIRDAASDLLGCVSFCMMDRWPNWSRLLGDYTTDPSIIQAPVLFIHADGDKVINCQHSILLHEHRTKSGLPSELYIQQSTDVYIKGHNYFDYEADVVIPTRNFLHKLLSSQGDIGSSPTLLLGAEVVQRVSKVPAECAKYTEDFLMLDDKAKPSKYTPYVYVNWLCCPCFFCTEGCLACGYNNVKRACRSKDDKSFNYQLLRPEEAAIGGLMQVLVRKKSFDRLVNEEEAAKSMQKALVAKRQYNNVANDKSNTVENPMVSASEDVRGGRRPRRTSGSSSTASSVTDDSGKEVMEDKVAFPPAKVLPAHALVKQSSTQAEVNAENRKSLNYVPG